MRRIHNLRDVPHPKRAEKQALKRAGTVRRAQQDDLRNRLRGTNGTFPVSVSAQFAPKPPAIGFFNEVLATEPEAVFGQYPRGFLRAVLPALHAGRHEVLHVCSGSLRAGEGIRVDLRAAAVPDVRADGRHLPFRDGAFRAVMLDPPYTADYAANLYGTDYPLPSHLLAEAARVVRPCGRIAFVHFLVPYPPPGCRFVKVLALSTGCGYALRAVSIFEREQDALPGVR